PNVGGLDRALRIAVGLALIVLAATGTIGVWGYLGLLPLATGLTRRCPPYALLGWNTCATNSAPPTGR
ncbi:YgaP family membrane protein, partial [Salmonella enterica]|uniref:YgaP family membrane protein n=1 Tax=Salmonella enterica TaxID=28901 RepID=UPI003FD6C44C